MRLIIVIVWLCLMSLPLEAGQTYYITKGGSDAAAGTDWGTSWETIAKLNATMVAGDTVRFGSGIWYNDEINPPANGHGAAVTVYACSTYTTATRSRTTISAGIVLDSNWSVHSGNIYVNDFTGWGASGEDSRVLTQDDSMLVAMDSINVITSAAQIAQMTEGTMFEDWPNDKIYVWCRGNANPNECLMVVGVLNQCCVEITSANTSNVEFFGLRMTHGSQWGIHIDAAGCDSNLISNCTICLWGGYSGSNCGAWTSEQSTADSTTYAIFNEVRACSLGWSMTEGGRVLSHVVATYAQHRFIIDSCVIHSSGNGVYFKDKSAHPQHYGNTAKFNTMYNLEQSGVLWTSHHVSDSVYGNVIYDCVAGIQDLGSYQGPLNGKSFICNNTIHHCDDRGIHFWDQSTGGGFGFLGYNNEIKFNIIYACTTTGGNETIGFELSTDTTQEQFDIDSNMYYLNYYTNDANLGHRARKSGVESTEWSDWIDTDRYGFDVHGTVVTDPAFNNAASHDYSRPSASGEMNQSYGGRTWTIFGAVQSAGSPPAEGTIHVPFHY